jgi:WD40 repeat protein
MNCATWLEERRINDISFQSWLMAKKIAERTCPYVFISYSHKDSSILEKIVKVFEKEGLVFWFDNRELLKNSNKNFNDEINEGLRGAFCVISFMSQNYWNSTYCPLELDIALDNRSKSNVAREYEFLRYHENILFVDLDGWKGTTPDKNRLMEKAGSLTIINFNANVTGDEESRTKKIVEDLLQNHLLQWMIKKDFSLVPEIPDFFSRLKEILEKNFKHVEWITELSLRVKNATDGKENPQLLIFLKEQSNQRNVFIYGEGGGGKTLTLKYFTQYLLEKNIPAIYVNVNQLHFEDPHALINYIENIVCGNAWGNVMRIYMKAVPNGTNSVVLLVDGINEIPEKYRSSFIKNCINNFPFENVKFILTSREKFSQELLSADFDVVEAIPPDDKTINNYLKTRGITVTETVRRILRTPMLLNIFTDTKTSKSGLRVRLNENPENCGQILENFFQLQIHKIGELATNHILFQYLLPEIAFLMVKNDSMVISIKEIWYFLDEIKEEQTNAGRRFEFYRRQFPPGRFPSINIEKLFPQAEDKFGFLRTTEIENERNTYYEFSHQLWRDFFCACKIAFEMTYVNQEFSILTALVFSDDVLTLVADLTRENTRMPFQKEPGEDWVFPSSNETKSKFPSAEKILSLWRTKNGHSAQIAVYNLLTIMRLGRKNNLANLNLSNLDLRLCRMNGCKFVEFWREKIYPSIFDNSWLNLNFFINDGHSSQITAVCTDGENFIFSGDSSGEVRCLDIKTKDWILIENFSAGEAVVDLAWKRDTLAVLYQSRLILYPTNNFSSVTKYINKHRSKSYRYVRFSSSGNVEVSFNVEPLIFFSVENEQLVSCKMAYDVPAHCAAWNPKSQQIVRSYLLRLVEVVYFNEENQRWCKHPALFKDHEKDLDEEQYHDTTGYIGLEKYGVDKIDRRTECICFNSDGKRFLIATGFSLLEFSSSDVEFLRSKKFQTKIRACCYAGENILVGVGNQLKLLDNEFNEIFTITGAKFSPIAFYERYPLENFFYVILANGEIKKLDADDAHIRQIRKVNEMRKFHWLKDKRTGECEFLVLPSKSFPDGRRFNFQTNLEQSLGWCYDTVEYASEYSVDLDVVLYDIGEDKSEIMLVKKDANESEKKIIQKVFAGVFIFGCSFRNLNGGTSKELKNFLDFNGGVTDEQY